MLRIRLRRTGKKNYALYRIVVAQESAPIKGKFIDRLGHYNPHTKEIVFDSDKLLAWINKGAQPTNTVAKLMAAKKVKHPRVSVYIAPKKAPKTEKTKEPKTAQPENTGPAPVEAADINKNQIEDTQPEPNKEENKESQEGGETAPAELVENQTVKTGASQTK